MILFDDGKPSLEGLRDFRFLFHPFQLDTDARQGCFHLFGQGGKQLNPVIPFLFLDEGYGGIQPLLVAGLGFFFHPLQVPSSQQVEQDACQERVQDDRHIGKEGMRPYGEGQGGSIGVPDAAVVAGGKLQAVPSCRQIT